MNAQKIASAINLVIVEISKVLAEEIEPNVEQIVKNHGLKYSKELGDAVLAAGTLMQYSSDKIADLEAALDGQAMENRRLGEFIKAQHVADSQDVRENVRLKMENERLKGELDGLKYLMPRPALRDGGEQVNKYSGGRQ